MLRSYALKQLRSSIFMFFLNEIETKCLLQVSVNEDDSLVKEILVRPGHNLVKFRLGEDIIAPFLRTGELSFKAILRSL